MARPRHLPDTLQAHDFQTLANTEPHPRTRIRFLGMAHLKEGREYDEIAMALRVPKIPVQGWVQRFKAEGLDGLRESPRSGAKRKLATTQEAEFKEAVLRLQEQRPSGRVTGYDIKVLLEAQFQVSCCLNTV